MSNNNVDYSIKFINYDADHCTMQAGYAAQAEENSTPEHANMCLWGILQAQFSRLQDLLVSQKAKKQDPSKYIDELIEKKVLKFYLGTKNDLTNFRYKVATIQPYKGNRDNSKLPEHLDSLREKMLSRWGAELISGMEVDDKLSIEAHKNPYNTLSIYNDKDGKQMPGWHWWWDGRTKYPRKPWFHDPKSLGIYYLERSSGSIELNCTGEYQIAYQMLNGDISDNIPPVAKGYGPVTVYELFKNNSQFKKPLDLVYDIYCHHHEDGHSRFIEIQRLVRMLKDDREKV